MSLATTGVYSWHEMRDSCAPTPGVANNKTIFSDHRRWGLLRRFDPHSPVGAVWKPNQGG